MMRTIESFLFQDTTETPLQSPPNRDSAPILSEEIPSSTSSAKSAASEEVAPSNEGLHCLGLEDLSKALVEAKVLKCVSSSFLVLMWLT